MTDSGDEMYQLGKRLFPICRSLTGNGVRETLQILKEEFPELEIFSVPSGMKAFDWTVPDEWNVHDAYILDPSGKKVIDFKESNLHVVGYSEPVDKTLDLADLVERIHTLPEQPDAIPYITSYYSRYWGFCATEKQITALQPGKYRAVIDSQLEPGELNYGEIILPGESEKEILISTYVCHPSMANNELSGPLVSIYLGKWLKTLKNRKYTYRIVFVPETIGAIVYISRHLESLKQNVIAGFMVTCVGDERAYSYLPSRNGETLADHAARHALKHIDPAYKVYEWRDRGSDERQYCSPGVDLPVATIMRSKYAEYPEYHTSLDNFDLVTPKGLTGGLNALKQAVSIIENNCYPKINVLCEPQLGKRGLYPSLSTKDTQSQVQLMMDFMSYADGTKSLLEIADMVNCSFFDLHRIYVKLDEANLIE
ncbi:DUF4910 domain-containing protein [Enterovibrio paralichthyis]|uniref:DUF4910 domain-containing protein n=1 Tax=Enterovibrio paralichthyis TaxID=2853805 RepID=UPI001C452FC6|nr:DUF4910 domain-containing protein [Enterovibrio paralichthyis]MBV7298632.1 DUF4910 domain-containing protein [Enterovibrio paralichthyis]